MKLENNWHYKTIEHLEKDVWKFVGDETNLIEKIYKLRQKVLNDFTVEDLRIMISQQVGLNYLIPLAIEILSSNLFAEGDFYEGDLLQVVLNIDRRFWNDNRAYLVEVNSLIANCKEEMVERKIDAAVFLRK